jgi:serine protease
MSDVIVQLTQKAISKEGNFYSLLHKIQRNHRFFGFSESMLSDVSGIFRIPSIYVDSSLIDRLSNDDRVEIVEKDVLYKLPKNEFITKGSIASEDKTLSPNDPMFKEQWGFSMINVEKAWRRSTGKGAIVAVLDTGVAYEKSPDGRYIRASDMNPKQQYRPYDVITGRKKAYDFNGHGTHVSSTIGGWTNNNHGVAGIAYDCKILPVKVLSDDGYGSISGIAEGIRYAVKNGAHIISMSLGGTGYSKILENACQYAHKNGVLVVAAAGNNGNDERHYPAAYDCVFAVSSVGPTGNLAYYSSYGDFVDITAPGGDKDFGETGGIVQNSVVDRKDGFYWFQGTSMATPMVSGVAALVVGSGLKGSEELWKRLSSTAVDKGNKNYYGSGLVDAGSAVK